MLASQLPRLFGHSNGSNGCAPTATKHGPRWCADRRNSAMVPQPLNESSRLACVEVRCELKPIRDGADLCHPLEPRHLVVRSRPERRRQQLTQSRRERRGRHDCRPFFVSAEVFLLNSSPGTPGFFLPDSALACRGSGVSALFRPLLGQAASRGDVGAPPWLRRQVLVTRDATSGGWV
jgi:hypothetical protein